VGLRKPQWHLRAGVDRELFAALLVRIYQAVKPRFTILDGVQGWGHYVGTYLAWGVHNNGWWGEGEIKFYLDGDTDFPTICGTGTEDYFCGSYDFDSKGPDGVVRYTEFSTPYSGLAQVLRGDGHYDVQQRFGLYRWHIMDPVRFEKNLNDNGTIILKFFLHVSKKEQKKRFMARIEDKTKNWKFSIADLKERALWDKYMACYEDMLSSTSQPHAPWFVIPADDKWFARLVIAYIIYTHFEKLKLSYPRPTQKQVDELAQARTALLAEKG